MVLNFIGNHSKLVEVCQLWRNGFQTALERSPFHVEDGRGPGALAWVRRHNFDQDLPAQLLDKLTNLVYHGHWLDHSFQNPLEQVTTLEIYDPLTDRELREFCLHINAPLPNVTRLILDTSRLSEPQVVFTCLPRLKKLSDVVLHADQQEFITALTATQADWYRVHIHTRAPSPVVAPLTLQRGRNPDFDEDLAPISFQNGTLSIIGFTSSPNLVLEPIAAWLEPFAHRVETVKVMYTRNDLSDLFTCLVGVENFLPTTLIVNSCQDFNLLHVRQFTRLTSLELFNFPDTICVQELPYLRQLTISGRFEVFMDFLNPVRFGTVVVVPALIHSCWPEVLRAKRAIALAPGGATVESAQQVIDIIAPTL
jgi:hypothetical protein